MAVFETVLSNSSAGGEVTKPAAPGEIVLGILTGIDADGRPLVEFNDLGESVPAMATVHVMPADTGRTVALLFANGDPRRPVIIGLIHTPLVSVIETTMAHAGQQADAEGASRAAADQDLPKAGIEQTVRVDGERVVIEGKQEVVLKCGDASITLTSAGKVLIRGKYLLNRSSGVNRIMGGSVQVN